MRAARTLLYTLLPLFAGCQLLPDRAAAPPAGQVRLQGELSVQNGQMLLRPCHEQRRFVVLDSGRTGLSREVDEQLAAGNDPLFADLRGALGPGAQPGVDGQLQLSERYRLQAEGQGCQDAEFRRLSLRASGNEPFWSISVSSKGLLLERPEQAPLALPYVEEQLPGGRLNFSSEADGQRLELWVAPQRCIDSMSGALRHLSAELRLNGAVQRGCAYFGGMRDE